MANTNETYRAGVVGIYKTSTIPGIARNADFTYGTAFPLIWLVAEVDATIIAASIPFFRPLVRAVMGTKQKNSYSLSKRSRSGANPLGSQPERPGFDSDNGSDRNILSLGGDNPSKLNTTVPHSYHIDEGRVIPEAARREHRDSF